LRTGNVIDVDYDAERILDAVHRCLFDEDFRGRCRHVENPYGTGDAGRRIAERLAEISLDPVRILRKKMMSRGESRDGWYR